MNEANPDKDFDAAVIQLRSGNNKNLLKFCAIVLLVGIAVTTIVTVSFSITETVKSYVVD